jgi:effector-binding domain-containing protein
MEYKCETKKQAAQPTLSVRTKVAVQDLPPALGKAYGEIMQYLFELGEHPVGAPFTAYYNMDMANMDIEIGFPVAKKLPDKGEIMAGELPAGKVAMCMHKGPYGDCKQAYEALGTYIQKKGLEPTGIAYEIYLNEPGKTPPSELLTQIVFPLKN